MNKIINIQKFLNENRFSPYQWMIFIICFLVAFFDGMDTAAIGYIAPNLLDDWGIGKKDLVPVLNAALFGLAIGAMTSGPLADKFGRKLVLTTSVLLFSSFCIASSYANNLTEMSVLRFITGLGLGAAMPSAVTLLTEYSPIHKRATIVNTMYTGFPLGAAAGGFFAAWLIPNYGWRTALFWCGFLPFILGVVMIFIMPCSVSYLAVKQESADKIRKILHRINPNADLEGATFVTNDTNIKTSNVNPMAMIMNKHYRLGSIMLWISYFAGLIIFYSMINWMPILFREANMPKELGLRISGLFALGGLGTIVCGYLMDRFDGNKLIAFLSFLTALSVATLGWAMGQGLVVLIAVVLFCGVVQNTAQASLPALAAQFYPAECRSTGVAWMLGIGRFGAITGTFLTGQLIAWKLDYVSIFIILAIPALILSACLLIKQKIYSN